MFPRKRSLGALGGRPFWESLEEFQTYLPPHPSFLELTPPPPRPYISRIAKVTPHTIAVETTNSLATKLLIVPKFTSYFIYSRVYNIGVFKAVTFDFNSRLLLLWYCFISADVMSSEIRVFRVFSKYRHAGKLHCNFFLQKS